MTITVYWPVKNEIFSALCDITPKGFLKKTETIKKEHDLPTEQEANEICRKLMQGEMKYVNDLVCT